MLGSVRLRIIVWILDAHVVESVVVGDGETLCTEGEEIANDWAVLQMPFSIRHADFVSDDGEELAPERKSGNSGNLAKRRKVERVNVCPVYKIDQRADTESASKHRSGWIFSENLSYDGYSN